MILFPHSPIVALSNGLSPWPFFKPTGRAFPAGLLRDVGDHCLSGFRISLIQAVWPIPFKIGGTTVDADSVGIILGSVFDGSHIDSFGGRGIRNSPVLTVR